ncbi:MBL fold metallo-hydrolase [Microbacterium sp. Root61]|uniref:MBL fold metallo-hydrolase n=1 Tax=Microbacterium sp. Root61 TaxID=1736570 RepID=UPI0007012B9B|nr:MBL fold metallo-hydrolase [Microbacterium sp. Root61]KRA24905.1 MBL fold metallo-hydrolase [Microbacterium sp. Root61]
MRLTHFGHAAVLVETDGGRALFDPGTYSSGFESMTELDVILVTHAHADHLDAARLVALREANPGAILVANAEATAAAGAGRPGDRQVADEMPFEAAGIRVQPTGALHAPIYPTLPAVANSGFILDDAVWHPGDAFDAVPRHVDVLLLPVGGPWMKVADAIDFAKAVAPRVIVPIHQAGLADVHRQLHYGLLKNLVPSSELLVLDEGVAQDV